MWSKEKKSLLLNIPLLTNYDRFFYCMMCFQGFFTILYFQNYSNAISHLYSQCDFWKKLLNECWLFCFWHVVRHVSLLNLNHQLITWYIISFKLQWHSKCWYWWKLLNLSDNVELLQKHLIVWLVTQILFTIRIIGNIIITIMLWTIQS